jgi:hypothetical protein
MASGAGRDGARSPDLNGLRKARWPLIQPKRLERCRFRISEENRVDVFDDVPGHFQETGVCSPVPNISSRRRCYVLLLADGDDLQRTVDQWALQLQGLFLGPVIQVSISASIVRSRISVHLAQRGKRRAADLD